MLMEVVKPQNIQLVLYFDADIRSKIFGLCNDFIKDYEFAQPIVLPFDQNILPPADMPLAIITLGDDSRLQICASLVVINVSNIDQIFGIGEKLVNIFAGYDVKFYRTGVVFGYGLPSEKIEIAKEKFFTKYAMPKSDFMYARFFIEDFDNRNSINLWKRYLVNLEATPDLLAEFDINTLVSEKIDVNNEFLKKFLDFAQTLTEKHLEEDDVL